MATVILLRRVFVQDLDAFTTQWREYLFNTLDPDGPILENLVINSTAFELADGALIWTNPDNGDTYTWNATTDTVTKTVGAGPTVPPPLPDLSDPYGLIYVHEFKDWDQRTCRFEIYRRNYVGASEDIDGSDTNLVFNYENEGKVFVQFRGSMASLTLTSQVSKKFHEIFEADERDHYGRFVRDAVVIWTGWITPDIFSEPYSNPPYRTTLAFNDGIGGLKNLPFPDVNANGFTGLISEKDVIVACLSRIGLRLDIHIACNIREERMDTLSAPIEQSMVNMEAFVELKDAERLPLDCYAVLEKVLKSWNAFILQEDNKWWIVREPELYEDLLTYKRFDADGLALGVATKNLNKTFIGEGIRLHRANLETKPAFTNVAVSQEYGELLVENGNFAVNGDLEKWKALFINSVIRGWILDDWTYDKLNYYPYTSPSTLGRVRRVTDSVGLEEKNNYINIYEVVRSFADPVGRLISKPFPIKQEVGNQLQVTFKTRCNTKGSDKRLVEAYFNISVQVGTKWLAVNSGTGDYEWSITETRLRWKVAEVMRWENIVLPAMPIPEDGDVKVYLYQIVQVGSVAKVEYVCDFDDIEIKLVDNPALQNEKIFYKTNNPETYTSTLEELTIELGDVATVLSQNAKIVANEPSSKWTRPGDATAVPLAQLICRELANQYQRTTYRLKGGEFYADASRLTNYEDTANEPNRRFLLSGGDWNAKKGEWNPDFVEINQTETTVEIRVVLQPKSGRNNNTGSNGGGGPDATGSDQPAPPAVPVDIGDLDDVIPIIKDGIFKNSGITATRDGGGNINEYQFPFAIRIPAATDDQHAVRLNQILTKPLTGYTVGANTALAAADTILGAFQKVQGQINARVSGGGDVNYLQKITSAGVIGDSQIFDNGIFVGIGTNVATSGHIFSIKHPTDARFDLSSKTAGHAILRFISNNADFTNIDSSTSDFLTSKSIVLQDNGGRVGIGIIPQAKLDVKNTVSSSENIRISQFEVAQGIAWYSAIPGANVDERNWAIITSTNAFGDFNIRSSNIKGGNPISAGTDRFTILNSGNVGININAPSNTLDVNGTARIRSIANGDGFVLTKSATGVVTASSLVKEITSVLSIGDTSLDYMSWDNTSKTFGIFSQAQYLHKYRGGAAGALNMGQFDVSGNASINNTSNANLLFGTNNTSRLEILAAGDVLLKKVDAGTGETLMIEAGGRIVKGNATDGVPNAITITSTATVTINVQTNRWNNILLQSNAVINITAIATSNFFRAVLRIKQDATGSRAVTWNTGGQSIVWKDGNAPVLAGSANWEDLIELFWDGTRINGVHYGSFG